jgi:hypothetical protein
MVFPFGRDLCLADVPGLPCACDEARNRSDCYLLGGVVFGLILEYLQVLTGEYTYGHFRLMPGHGAVVVRLWVGTARLFSGAWRLPLGTAAALDALLALKA